MPQLQVVNTTRDKPDPTGVSEFFSRLGKDYRDRQDQQEIGNILEQYKQNREHAFALEDAYINLQQSNVGPSKRLQAENTLKELSRIVSERDKALNKTVKGQMQSAEEREKIKRNLMNKGFPEEDAELYIDAPDSVKNRLMGENTELVSRGFRKSLENPVKAVSEAVVPQEPEPEWPEPIIPENMTAKEKVAWQNKNEKENTKTLSEITSKKKALRENGIRISSMIDLNDSKKLPSNLGKLIIDPKSGDIRPEAQLAGLANEETQLYVKNLKQFLKGAKEFFGARVTNFDVTSFMSQLPTLLNTEEGRRLILKQMEYVNQLENAYTEVEDATIKHYKGKASPIQVREIVDDKVKDREAEIIYKINNVVEASKKFGKMAQNPEKYKDTVLMQTPEGKFKAVRKENVQNRKDNKWILF